MDAYRLFWIVGSWVWVRMTTTFEVMGLVRFVMIEDSVRFDAYRKLGE